MNQVDFNYACMGYCIAAMKNTGFDEDQIRKVIGEFSYVFDSYDAEDAIDIYKKYKNSQ